MCISRIRKSCTGTCLLIGLGFQWIPFVISPVQAQAQSNTAPNLDRASLDQLLADYQDYGLPLPPDDAELVKRKRNRGTFNGAEQFSYDMVFRTVRDGKTVYWIGCEQLRSDSEPLTEEVMQAPSIELVRQTVTVASNRYDSGFGADPDLALAVQCHARGWVDLAGFLLERSRKPHQDLFEPPRPRPAGDRAALAQLAWDFWCNEFARSKGDRAAIVARHRQLRDGPFNLNSLAHRNLIDDMEQTLTKRDAAEGSYEALINSLVDAGIQGAWQGQGFSDLRFGVASSKECRKLRDAGLDAVPTLIRHLSDFRLTRCIERSKRGTWHVRIADVVAVLLNGLVSEEFSYDFLIKDGRGKCLDQAHVLHWWSEVQASEALKKGDNK